jgi:hypothetical protein
MSIVNTPYIANELNSTNKNSYGFLIDVVYIPAD